MAVQQEQGVVAKEQLPKKEMKKNESKIAILIFARSSECEANIKSFPQSKEIFDSLNEHTLKLVSKTKLPYYRITEQEQVGDSFGERFTNAVQSIYDLGYQSVIVIGNDTPHLTTKHLLLAEKNLHANKVVVGKATDGGFYLLGIQKDYFNAELFLKLPWQTQQLTTTLSKLFLTYKAEVVCLETLDDIDALHDIKKILQSTRKMRNAIRFILLETVEVLKFLFIPLVLFYKTILQSYYYNKGSPFIIYN